MKIPGISILPALVGLTLLAAPTPAEATGEEQFLTQTRQLTYEGRRAGEGYYAPDGRRMVFQSERDPENPFYQIFELDLETGETRRVSPGQGKTTCAFIRPGSSEILFASTHHDPNSLQLQKAELDLRASGKERRYAWDYDPEMELYVEVGKGEYRRLTNARGYDAEASYSPDGEWIVFASNRNAYNRKLDEKEAKLLEVDPSVFIDLYVVRADGSGLRQITDTLGYDGGPFFAPDGEHVIWRRFDESGLTADVWMARLDGSEARPLTAFKSMSWAPYVHPSGKYAVFTSNKLGFENFELYVVDTRGEREPVRITYTDGFDGLPVPTPDGNGLTWTTNRRGGQSQLFTAKWNHEAVLQALAASPRTGPGAKTDAAQSFQAIRQQVTFLASDEMNGRLTGTQGARAAAEYAAGQLRALGAKPAPGQSDFLQPFAFTAGMKDDGSSLTVTLQDGTELSFDSEEQIRALSFSDSQRVEGEVVFAGYGLKLPDDSGFPYDSFHGLDLQDKIVVVLRYFPEDVDQETRGILSRYSGLRYKAMQARQKGAKAMLIVTGPNSPNAGETVPMTFDTALSGSGIVAASISAEVAKQLMNAVPDTSLKSAQTGLDSGNPHVTGFEIPGVKVSLEAKVLREKRTGYNVVGYLPANAEEAAEEFIAVGAHFDHLGRGGHGNSLADKSEADDVHRGADDNASGVAVALQVARYLSERERKRPVLITLWSGEEMGLLGSTHFVKTLEAEGSPKVAAYLNFDMVGRLRDNRLSVQSAGSSPVWGGLIEQSNVPVGFDLNVQADPYLPTDSSAFYNNGIPALNLFTGSHEDYHRPSDSADKLNYDGLERIAKFSSLLASKMVRLDEAPAYAEVERKQGESGDRDSLRAYTGTIPDYTSDAKGLLLSGVVGGGPAEAAGLAGGDLIVSFAGQEITNIYDYTYALDAVKVDEPIQVAFMRDGERVEVTMTPRARK